MALYGWQQQNPPRSDPSAGFTTYKPPRRRGPKMPHQPHRPTAPVRQHPFDPLAPTSDADLRAKAQGLTNAELAPILAQIKAMIEGRSQAGQAAIQGTTQTLGNLWREAAPQTAAAYNEAIGQQGAVNSELANRLGAVGQNLGGELQAKLALQDAPQNVVGQVAGGATQTATGVANANFAKGAAETGRLVAESAHGQEYAAKQPGIVGLMGLQHSKDLEMQLNKELADQLAAQSSKAQDTFTQIYLHEVDQEWNKTLARTSGQFKSAQAAADAKYHAQQIAFKKAELSYKRAKAQADRQAANARNANTVAGANERNRNTVAGANARNQNTQRNSNLKQNKWQVNPDGSFKMRKNNRTGKMERIPIKPPKKAGSSSSGL